MPSPAVSIVVAAYQAEQTIEQAVESARSQTSDDLEVIVVDDGSTDRTREVVENLIARTADARIVLSEPAPNAGPSAARNRGIAMARGEWIGFLDSDDQYRPKFVELMHAAAAADDSIDVAVCAHVLVQVDGQERVRTPYRGTPVVDGPQAAAMMLGNRMTPYVWDKLFRRSVLGEAPFPLEIHRAEDAVVVLRALLATRTLRIVDVPLLTYYVSSNSLTWGRVAPVEESDHLTSLMTQVSAPLLDRPFGRSAVAASTLMTYVNAAHQGISHLPRREANAYSRQCARRITWSDIGTAARRLPFAAAAGLLLKSVPALYRRAYFEYIQRAYALGG